MNIQRERILFRLADTLITLVAIFLLLDAMLGFTRHQQAGPARPQLVTQDADAADLTTSCLGGFTNQRTVHGRIQVAAHGTPFNAYQLTFINTGTGTMKIHGVTVNLVDSSNHIFARQHITRLVRGHSMTLSPDQPRQIVETAGIKHPVASCDVLSWQP
ncbi:MAG: hypothetical protein ACHP9Z_24580 [Streptosporangiales bacterium]